MSSFSQQWRVIIIIIIIIIIYYEIVLEVQNIKHKQSWEQKMH